VFAAAATALDDKLKRRRKRFVLTGIAATVMIGMTVGLVVSNRPAVPTLPLAAIDRVVGPAEYADTGTPNWRGLPEEGTELTADTSVRTGPGSRLGLLMTNGVSLRLAEATVVRFIAPGRIELVSGRIYADAGQGEAAQQLAQRIVIETGAGTTWDVGTQFELLYIDELYRLRVREGRVQLRQSSRELSSEAGEQLSIDAEQHVRRGRIAKDDPDWLWTESVAPDPAVDARPVTALLIWVSRQTGREVAYARPELELQAATTMLYGRVRFVEPLEALDTMLATTDFNYTLLEDGTILIDAK